MLGKKRKPNICNTQITIDPNLIPLDGIKDVSNLSTEPEKTSVVDTYRVPYKKLLQYATGASWPVTYYRRILATNDTLELLDLNEESASQQYEKIEGLIIKVTSPIDPQQDSTSKEWVIQGSGTIANSIVPNKYDFFLAEVGDGQIGVLSITESEKMAINKVAIYQVNFSMLYELTTDIRDIIDAKVARELVFEETRIDVAESPLMSPEDHRRFIGVIDAIRYIRETYPYDFFSKATQSLIVPVKDETRCTYDAWLTSFARQVGCTDEHTSFCIYTHPPFDADDVRTVWWALINQHMRGIDVKQMLRYDPRTFAGMRLPGSIAWSGYNSTYFPAEKDALKVRRFWQYNYAIMPPQPMDKSEGIEINYDENSFTGVENLPIYISLDDEMYVFSEAFYNGRYASQLEFQMYKYLKREPINPKDSLQLAEHLESLPKMERFYYTPVVLMLLLASR